MDAKTFDELTQQVQSVDVSALKLETFDRVADIFRGSVITPEAAPFVVGRLFEAMQPWSKHTAAAGKLKAELLRRHVAEDLS
ncbi:MAG: hypothetical protein ACREA9_19765 [Pyrinomonadaceae bacterium]